MRRRSGAGESRLAKAYTDIATIGLAGAYPDRFEATHVRHEDIDNHQIEAGILQGTEPGFAPIADRHLKDA